MTTARPVPLCARDPSLPPPRRLLLPPWSAPALPRPPPNSPLRRAQPVQWLETLRRSRHQLSCLPRLPRAPVVPRPSSSPSRSLTSLETTRSSASDLRAPPPPPTTTESRCGPWKTASLPAGWCWRCPTAPSSRQATLALLLSG